MEMYIVLGVTLFMMVMFIWNKVPFGVITMTCCLILAATGIVDVQTAFSGFSNKIVILIAPMLALSGILSRTSMVHKVSGILNGMKGKRGILLIATIYLVAAIFAQFIPATAALTIFIVFLMTLDNTGDITPNRILLPLLGILVAWKFRFPIGIGAATFATLNGLYEGIITNPQYHLKMMDPLIFSIIPGIILTIYCFIGWKLMPKSTDMNTSNIKEKKVELLTPMQEKIVYAVFVVVMLMMLFNQWTGNFLYLAPAIGVLILIYTKILSVPDAIKGINSDMVWMLAGVLVVADSLGKSGASDVIGKLVLNLLGTSPSSFKVMLIFAAATVIMTTFISNMATQTVLIPIAASVCLAGGWDPRGLVLIIGTANMFAVGFPSGSGEAAVCFAAGGYNPLKVLKFTLPYIALAILSCAVVAQVLYPLY